MHCAPTIQATATPQEPAKDLTAAQVPAVKIAGGRLHRQIDQSELLVHGDLCPDAGVASVFRGTFLPGVVAKLALLRDGMENPEAPAGSHAESPHVSFLVPHALRRHPSA